MKRSFMLIMLVLTMTLTGCSITSEQLDRTNSIGEQISQQNKQQIEYSDIASELSSQLEETVTLYVYKEQLSEKDFIARILEISDSYIQNLIPALLETELSQEDIDTVYPTLESFILWRSNYLTSISISAKLLYQKENEYIDVSESLQALNDLMDRLHEIEPEKENVFNLQKTYSDYLPCDNYFSDITGAGTETIDLTQMK